MRRLAAPAAVLLLLVALLVVGWNRWPHEEATTLPSSSPAALTVPTAAGSTTTTGAVTTVPPTTTTLPPPEIVLVPVPVEETRPTEWFHALAAVSAGEAWAAMYTDALEEDGTDLIGHVVDGAWTLYALGAGEWTRVMGLAPAPDGTVWAATDIGVFSFDGQDWARRFPAPAGGVAVGEDGTVWIGGKEATGNTSRLWLARWDGASWERLDPLPEEALEPWGQTIIAVQPDGEAWIAHRPGWWVDEDLTRYDGHTMEVFPIPGVPDPTPDNGIFPVRVFEVEAAPNGYLWAVGYLAADPRQAVLACYDGAAWTLVDWPFPPPAELPLAVDISAGPDGVMWFAFHDGLRSFDGTTWQSHLEEQVLFNVDVAPDGAVWYSDEAGLHVLEVP